MMTASLLFLEETQSKESHKLVITERQDRKKIEDFYGIFSLFTRYRLMTLTSHAQKNITLVYFIHSALVQYDCGKPFPEAMGLRRGTQINTLVNIMWSSEDPIVIFACTFS